MRKRIYQIIENAEEKDTLSSIYDIFMMVVIIASLIPLTIKEGSDIPKILQLLLMFLRNKKIPCLWFVYSQSDIL